MSKIIYQPRISFEVQIGEGNYVQKLPQWEADPELTHVTWRFSAAFNQKDDASAYADRMAEDHEFVRVIDREEKE